jgi:hypothetical protein
VNRSLLLRLLLIAGLVVPTTALLSALPASAATPEKCTFGHTTAVSPGLEAQHTGDGAADDIQTFTAATTLTACTGLSGITKGSGTAVLKSVNPLHPYCKDLLTSGSYAQGPVTITWNNGKTSKSSNLRVTVTTPLHGKLTGTIGTGTAGGTETRLRGKAVSGASEFQLSKGDCTDAKPVTQLTGAGGTIQLG